MLKRESVQRQVSRFRLEAMLEALVIVAAIATIPVTVMQLRGDAPGNMIIADWAIWAVFAAEYVTLLAITADRGRFIRTNRLAASVIILSFPYLPALFAFARLARISRLTRLFRLVRLILVSGRGIVAIRYVLARRGLLYLAALTGFLIVAAGALMTALEPDTVNGGFGSGVWWAIVTATTVGYGDISPSSPTGRLVAGVLMVAGIGLMASVAAAVAAYFVGQDERTELTDLRERLARIEALLVQQQDQSGS
jgi:voltage-gated potassium channel